MAGPDDCLTSDELTSLLEGREPGDERDRFMVHLDRCPDCRTVLAESAQHLESATAVRRRGRHWLSFRVALVAVVIAFLFFMLLVLWALRTS